RPQASHRPRALHVAAVRHAWRTPLVIGKIHPVRPSPVFAMAASEDAGIIGTEPAFDPCPFGQQREPGCVFPEAIASSEGGQKQQTTNSLVLQAFQEPTQRSVPAVRTT